MSSCRRLLLVLCAATPMATGQENALRPPAWPVVPRADLSKLSPSGFSDEELDLPYYLAHFHRLANSVVETGSDRGFIGIPVWRAAQDNKPYNARIMESILSLAFFYSTPRPWNIHYASPAVRARLEAALDFWCRIQDPDGRLANMGGGDRDLRGAAARRDVDAQRPRPPSLSPGVPPNYCLDSP